MSSKKFLVAALAILVVAGGAYYYSSSSALQGKFGGIGSLKTTPGSISSTTTKTASPLLTLSNKSGSADNRTISVASIDYDTVYDPTDEMTTDPKAYSLATVSMKFATGVTPCTTTQWEYILTDGNSYSDYSDEIFDKLTMHFRSLTDNFWVTKVDNNSRGTEFFTLTDVSTLTGSDYYYYVDGTVKDGIDTSVYNKPLTLYLRDACVMKAGTKYEWEKADAYGQNSYFDISTDGKYGFKIGTLKITE